MREAAQIDNALFVVVRHVILNDFDVVAVELFCRFFHLACAHQLCILDVSGAIHGGSRSDGVMMVITDDLR